MSADGKFRRLKAIFGNAVVFGIGWGVTGFLLWLVLREVGAVPRMSIIDGVGMSIRVGGMGFITGAAFPSIMRIAYGGKRLSEISWLRFGLVGAVITGLFVPTLMQTMNVLSGDGMVPFNLIRTDIVLAALLGGIAAALSLRLAQYADKLFPDTFQDHLDRLEKQTDLTSGEAGVSTQRIRSAEYLGRDDS